MDKKKKLKGFTLVELIIVMMIFSLIMISVVELLKPVTQYFVRSSNFEGTTACVDNMRRAIEGNLKYADRVRAYSMYCPYKDPAARDTVPSDDLLGQVSGFYDEFFKDRKVVDSSGTIYVLVFDNSAVSDISGYDTLTEFTEAQLNAGKIVLYRFTFDNYNDALDSADEVVASYNVTDWYVNQKLYGNYEYHFSIGNFNARPSLGFDEDGHPIYSSEEFSPSDFVIQIGMTELRKLPDGGLERIPATANAVSSFSMKNVIDSSVSYLRAAKDNKPVTERADGSYDFVSVNRFRMLDVQNALRDVADGLWKDGSGNVVAKPDADDNPDADYFYFIYTLPETTYTLN